MKQNIVPLLMIGSIVALFGLGIAYEAAVWNECRETNSWMYCMRMMSK